MVAMGTDVSGDQFAEIARSLSSQQGVGATLEHATLTALAIIDGCDHAGVSLVTKKHKIETIAQTDDVVRRADELQYEHREGPCLQSIHEQETVYSPDLSHERRWPSWAPRARAELGIRSVLGLQLFVGPTSLGCLNLFSDSPEAFQADQRISALALASHVAVAMTAEQNHQDLNSALVNRTIIGRAEGMLMQRFDITADQAFAALVRISQDRNIKLHLVAADIAEKGIRPDLFD